MRTVTYVGSYDAVEVEVAPRRWQVVQNGESIEVGDVLGASLLEQTDNWAESPAPTKKAPAAKKESDR